MRTRHRIPSIFNLSMVDVLCCALGCVILLWLLNLRNVHEQAEQATQTDERLTVTQQDLAAAVQERDDLRSRLDETAGRLTDLTAQHRALQGRFDDATAMLTATQQDRDAARKELADLNKLLASLKDQKKDVDERLARQVKDYGDLDKKLATAMQRVTTLESQLRDKDAVASGNAKRADNLAGRLADAEARVKKLEPLANMVPALQDDVKKYRDQFTKEEALAKALEKEIKTRLEELAAAAKSLKDLEAAKGALDKELLVVKTDRDKEMTAAKADRGKLAALEERLIALLKEIDDRKKELADAGRRIELLQTDKKALLAEADRARAAADNRFAGITLTGRRVVFLVDMSGSMDRVDKDTPAPNKWPTIRETVAKIMRSLPELEKFQVVVFSEKASYLLGQEDRWIDYDPAASADRVTQALAQVRPEGGTNLYAALETAFRFRPAGLDTVYLVSDGLPNMGEGLTPEQNRTLNDSQREEALGRHLRKVLRTAWNRDLPGQNRVKINGVGFFYESPNVGAFLWALARENEGSFVGMSKP
jgi:predicted  nucleic acid-binding Zn-ribbon protein